MARSGLEATAERDALTRLIYRILLGHLSDEIKELQKRSFSLTWAVGEAHYLIRAIAPNTREVELQEEQLLFQELAKLPALIVEKDGTRRAISAEDLSNAEYYWTVGSAFFASVEEMLREVPSNASLQAMAGALGGERLSLPAGLLLCTRPAGWIRTVLEDHEVAEIRIDRGQRRIALRWAAQRSPHLWRRTNINALPPQYLRPLRQLLESPRPRMLFPKRGVSVSGAEGEFAVESYGITFVLPGTPLAEFLSEIISRTDACAEDEYLLIAVACILERWRADYDIMRMLELFDTVFPDLLAFHPKAQSAVDLEGLRGAIQQVTSVFRTSLWQRPKNRAGIKHCK